MTESFLNGRTTSDVRGALLSAMAKLREALPGRHNFDYGELMPVVASALVETARAAAASAQWANNQWHVRPPGADHPGYHPARNTDDEDNRKIRSALWVLVGNGILYPKYMNPGTADGGGATPIVIQGIELTPYGEQVIADANHPLWPGFIEDFKTRCKVPVIDEVLTRLEDAIECRERDLLRATLVMVGLAAEETVHITHAALVHIGKIPTTSPVAKKVAANGIVKARHVLSEVRGAVEAWPDQGKDAEIKHNLRMAMLSLDRIRDARNKSSHPGKKVTDARHVEELLRSAVHHLPVLWSGPIAMALAKGGFTLDRDD